MLRLTNQSTSLPVTLAKLKAHLRIHSADNSQDDYLNDLISEASAYITSRTGKACVQSTFELTLPSFWTFKERFSDQPLYWQQYSWPMTFSFQVWMFKNKIFLPFPPLVSVAITYFDTNNETQTLDSSLYNVVKSDYEPGFVEPVATTVWPPTYLRSDAVKITFTTGSSLNAQLLPVYRRCLYLVCGWFFENREGQAKDIDAIERLLRQLMDGGYH